MEKKRPLLSKTQNVCLFILWILFIILAILMIRQIRSNRHVEEPFKEIKINDTRINLALKGYVDDFGDIPSLKDKIYLKDFKGDLSTLEKVYIALEKEPVSLCTEEEETTYNLEELNDILAKSFLDFSLKEEDINNLIGSDALGAIYNIRYNGEDITLKRNCQEDDDTEAILYKLISADANSTNLRITLKMAYRVKKEEQEETYFDYYKDVNEKEIGERLAKIDLDKIEWDKYDTYQYNYQIINDNYYLESIEKIS